LNSPFIWYIGDIYLDACDRSNIVGVEEYGRDIDWMMLGRMLCGVGIKYKSKLLWRCPVSRIE
jgi:hypothetical protein